MNVPKTPNKVLKKEYFGDQIDTVKNSVFTNMVIGKKSLRFLKLGHR